MDWLWLAFIPPFLFALSTVIDKVLVSKHFDGEIGVLILFTSFMSILVLPVVAIVHPEVFAVPVLYALLTIGIGALYVLYLFPYLTALGSEDASRVIPLFQLIPILTAVLAYVVLGEVLTYLQIIAGALIIIGAVGISIKFEKGAFLFKKKVLLLMLLASLFISISRVAFKFVAIETDFWTSLFWEQVGFLLLGVVLLLIIPKYRTQLRALLKNLPKKSFVLVLGNETINLVGVVVFAFVSILAPLGIVGVINGFQPLFVFLMWICITLFFPWVGKESLDVKTLVQKGVCILLLLLGMVLLGGSGV